MQYILILIAFILAFTVLFWLDRKKDKDESVANGIFNHILNHIYILNWDMNNKDIRDRFAPWKFNTVNNPGEEINIKEEQNYIEKLQGTDLVKHFDFTTSSGGKLKRADIEFLQIPENVTDLLFNKFYKKFGQPVMSDNPKTREIAWETPFGFLTFDYSGDNKLIIRLLNPLFYKQDFG